MNGAHAPLMLWIEGIVALGVMAAFVIHALFAFKREHVQPNPGRVRIGAAIQGLAIGVVIGFVFVPLRMQLMDSRGVEPGLPPEFASLALLPALVLLITIRRGGLLRTPVLSAYLRPYRRASLLKARDDTERQLAKLDAMESRGAPA